MTCTIDIAYIEHELRKRWMLPYRWRGKQDNVRDAATRFVYDCTSFEDVLERARSLGDASLLDYTLNRWYNFWSAMAVEEMFRSHPRVQPAPAYHQARDFAIDGIWFDHKTTVFPRAYPGTLLEAMASPIDIAHWLYENQSQGRRYHTKNRLFLILWSEHGAHWKLKARLGEIEKAISLYLDGFSVSALHRMGNGAQTDIIWFVDG
jgi:hypothetical protein